MVISRLFTFDFLSNTVNPSFIIQTWLKFCRLNKMICFFTTTATVWKPLSEKSESYRKFVPGVVDTCEEPKVYKIFLAYKKMFKR